MSELEDRSAARRAAIVDASIAVFGRYGFRKTSMDDLARAAGLSRQGLYLYFASKEVLFKEAVLRVIDAVGEAGKSALARDDLDVEGRIDGALEAMHGQALGLTGVEHMKELLDAASQHAGPAVRALEEGIVAAIARVLKNEGVASRWKDAGLGAKELADALYTASLGVKHRAPGATNPQEHLRDLVRIVCRGGAVTRKRA